MLVPIRYGIALSAALLTACSGGLDVATDYNPQRVDAMARYSTFDLLPPPEPEDGGTAVLGLADDMEYALVTALTARGQQRSSSNPDFRIAWSANIQGQSLTYVTRQQAGRTDVSSGRTATWEDGMIILDVADGSTDEFVWRGTGQTKMDRDVLPEDRRDRLAQAVAQILDEFPPRR